MVADARNERLDFRALLFKIACSSLRWSYVEVVDIEAGGKPDTFAGTMSCFTVVNGAWKGNKGGVEKECDDDANISNTASNGRYLIMLSKACFEL